MYLLHYIMISAELLNFGNIYFYTVIDNKKSVTEFRVEA